MENVVTEAVKLWEPPSEDTRLVLLTDDTVHTGRKDVGSHLLCCADYAKEHQVWLVSGLVVNQDNLCLVLFGPDGSALCRQPAIHLALPMKGTLKPANQVQVIHTKIGNLYLCVDADILHPETLRAAALKGADIVINIYRHFFYCRQTNSRSETQYPASGSGRRYSSALDELDLECGTDQ